MNIARQIWLNPILRESLLFVAAAIGVTLALSLADLAAALEDPAVGPIHDLETWGMAVWVALLTTAVKQLSVILLSRLGKLVSVTRSAPPAPDAGEIQERP